MSASACVGHAEFGDPEGTPIVFFHGIPGSRLLGASVHEQALACGARIIAIERPGCGRSDYRSVGSVAGWAQTVRQVADALGIERFSALGVSGGGPYALACAALFSARVDAVGLVSSVGTEKMPGVMLRSSRCLLALGRLSPLLAVAPLALVYRRTTRNLEIVLELLQAELAEDGVDDPRAAGLLLADLLEAFSTGYRGVAGDCARLRRWGFAPEAVHAPVYVWHGCDHLPAVGCTNQTAHSSRPEQASRGRLSTRRRSSVALRTGQAFVWSAARAAARRARGMSRAVRARRAASGSQT